MKRKVCSDCGRNRLLKFYSSKRAYKCNDCKKKTKRMRKKTSKSYLIKKLDELWSEAVKKKANYKCEYSKKETHLNSHHVFSRSNKAVRWDLDNGVCLNAGHHTLSSKFSAHKTPVEFIEWLKDERGEDWYKRLRKKARQVKKHTTDDLQQIRKDLKEFLNE